MNSDSYLYNVCYVASLRFFYWWRLNESVLTALTRGMIFNIEQFAKQYHDLGIPFWLVMVTPSPVKKKKKILNSVISGFNRSSHKEKVTRDFKKCLLMAKWCGQTLIFVAYMNWGLENKKTQNGIWVWLSRDDELAKWKKPLQLGKTWSLILSSAQTENAEHNWCDPNSSCGNWGSAFIFTPPEEPQSPNKETLMAAAVEKKAEWT